MNKLILTPVCLLPFLVFPVSVFGVPFCSVVGYSYNSERHSCDQVQEGQLDPVTHRTPIVTYSYMPGPDGEPQIYEGSSWAFAGSSNYSFTLEGAQGIWSQYVNKTGDPNDDLLIYINLFVADAKSMNADVNIIKAKGYQVVYAGKTAEGLYQLQFNGIPTGASSKAASVPVQSVTYNNLIRTDSKPISASSQSPLFIGTAPNRYVGLQTMAGKKKITNARRELLKAYPNLGSMELSSHDVERAN